MDKEIDKREPLPTGFKLREKKQEPKRDELPAGFKLRPKKEQANDTEHPYSGQYAHLTEKEYENLSDEEKQKLQEYVPLTGAAKGFLKGATFGLTQHVPGAAVEEHEKGAGFGEFTGALLPLSKMVNVIKGPAMKLAAKSPWFQKQIGSLLTMFGVGATEKAATTLAKGEIPTAEEVLDHGLEWAALDAALMGAGAAGKFAKGLLSRSQVTGLPRKEIVNGVTQQLREAGVDMTNPEKVSQAALEILEAPITEAEQAAGRQVQLAEREVGEVEKVGQEALKAPEVTPKDLKTRKISDEPVNKLTKETRTLAEPYELAGMEFKTEAEALEKNAVTDKIESVGTRAASEEELGQNIKNDIETRLGAAKAEYKPLYAQAEEAAETIEHTPSATAREAGEELKRLSRLETKPAGYEGVIRSFETVLKDIGYVVQREKGVISEIIQSKEVPLSDSIELARRLNEMIDFEAVEPTVKDAMRKVVKALKSDIRAGLAVDSEALAAFEMAEKEHGRVAGLFGKDSVRKIRGLEAGEKAAKISESPSALGDLKQVLSPEQMLQVEREMLEKLNAQSYEKGQKTLREMERHLSKENKKLARDIVESKNPHNPEARKKLVKESILDDMSNSLSNGTRPKKTLELWKNPQGQKLVKETFHNSPNWPEVKQYLEKQSFNDMVSSVLKDGKLDIKKFKEFINDPAMANNIRSIGGNDALSFFRNLHYEVKQMEQNLKLLDRLPKKSDLSKGKDILKKVKEKAKEVPKEKKIGEKALEQQRAIREETKGEKGSRILKRMAEKDFPIQAKTKKWREWFTETMGINEKGVMSVFGLMKLGLPNTVGSMIGFRVLNKFLTDTRVRNAFMEVAKHQHDPLKFILSLEYLGNILDEESSNDKTAI